MEAVVVAHKEELPLELAGQLAQGLLRGHCTPAVLAALGAQRNHSTLLRIINLCAPGSQELCSLMNGAAAG